MKEIRVKSIKPISYGTVEIVWEDGSYERITLSEILKKPMFKNINKTNFNLIQVMYDGCAVGWPDFDIEIGMTKWVVDKASAA